MQYTTPQEVKPKVLQEYRHFTMGTQYYSDTAAMSGTMVQYQKPYVKSQFGNWCIPFKTYLNITPDTLEWTHTPDHQGVSAQRSVFLGVFTQGVSTQTPSGPRGRHPPPVDRILDTRL